MYLNYIIMNYIVNYSDIFSLKTKQSQYTIHRRKFLHKVKEEIMKFAEGGIYKRLSVQ